jgi:hypothetical protein
MKKFKSRNIGERVPKVCASYHKLNFPDTIFHSKVFNKSVCGFGHLFSSCIFAFHGLVQFLDFRFLWVRGVHGGYTLAFQHLDDVDLEIVCPLRNTPDHKHKERSVVNRVTRLGEFSPFRILFILGSL